MKSSRYICDVAIVITPPVSMYIPKPNIVEDEKKKFEINGSETCLHIAQL